MLVERLARRHRAPVPAIKVAAALVAAAVLTAAAAAPCAHGQTEPGAGAVPPAGGESAADRLRAIADAFGAVDDAAAAGAWQSADAAYNTALDVMDLHRPGLESELGDPAVAAFRLVDEQIVDLVDALDTEDRARLRVAITSIEQAVMAAGSGAPADGASTAAAQDVIRWRTAANAALALGESGQWRDMRNAAIDLIDDVSRWGPDVTDAGGAQFDVDLARVFAMRLRAAALDQSLTDARVAAEIFSGALDRLEQGTGLAPTPRPPAADGSRLSFRAFEVTADGPGAVVAVPIVAEDIPQIGLGSMELVARWSPSTLRLLDVTWDVAEGSVARDDAVGRATLRLPAAPTGPSGSTAIAQLVFEVLDADVHGEDYLPTADVRQMETARQAAGELVRQGDTPRAAAQLAEPLVTLLRGQGVPGSLYTALDEHGLAAPLAGALLAALDAASRPAETDVITLAISELGRTIDATWASYLGALAKPGGVPVVLDALSADDTTGRPIPVAGTVPGQVLLPGRPTAGPASGEAASTAPTVPPQLVETAAGAESAQPALVTRLAPAGALGTPGIGAGESGGTSGAPDAAHDSAPDADTVPDAGPGFPLPLVVALALAAVLGLAAVLLGDRGGPNEPGQPG
ncbi:MAG: hypothetical protein ACK2T6_05765 [Anaerolineae bacterium]